jgi:hypothetical protein
VTESPPKKSSDISPRTLVAASVAGALATAAVSGVGIAGTLLGGALFPVLIALGREIVLRAADRAPTVAVHRTSTGGPSLGGPPTAERPAATARPAHPDQQPLYRRIRWRRVAITGGAAVAIVVAVFTVADLVFGESPVADRGSTFFARSTAPAPDPADQEAPGTPETPDTPTTTDPESEPPTTTGPETTTGPAPEEAVPEGSPPEETAPAPATPGGEEPIAPAPAEGSSAPEEPATTGTATVIAPGAGAAPAP